MKKDTMNCCSDKELLYTTPPNMHRLKLGRWLMTINRIYVYVTSLALPGKDFSLNYLASIALEWRQSVH